MIIFPAIDLKSGQCVRLYKGDMEQATVFNDTPADQARIFQSQGFEWIHVVDLDGAFAGKPENAEAVKAILKEVDIPVQLGGGIRSLNTIEEWLNLGVSRVILGTVALKEPQIVKDACNAFPGKIVVGLDAKSGYVATEGWAETSDMHVTELAKEFEDCGVAAIVYTDINRDGAMQGADVEGTKDLAESTTIAVIASGGISSNEDIAKIKAIESSGVVGVITGRALYDKAIDILHALKLAKGSNHA